MAYLAHSGVFWVGLVAALGALYFAPTIIAIMRKAESLGFIFLLNIAFPPAALVGALVNVRRRPRRHQPVVPVYQPADLVRPGPHL